MLLTIVSQPVQHVVSKGDSSGVAVLTPILLIAGMLLLWRWFGICNAMVLRIHTTHLKFAVAVFTKYKAEADKIVGAAEVLNEKKMGIINELEPFGNYTYDELAEPEKLKYLEILALDVGYKRMGDKVSELFDIIQGVQKLTDEVQAGLPGQITMVLKMAIWPWGLSKYAKPEHKRFLKCANDYMEIEILPEDLSEFKII